MSPTSILTPLSKDLGNLRQTVLVDILVEYGANRLRHDRIEHLTLGHLMAAHQVQFQLAE